MAAAKRWRVEVSQTRGGNFWQLLEVAFLSSSGVDLSVGGVASANSEYSADYRAALAFDKNLGTAYCNVTNAFPCWLEYDHPAPVEAAQVRFVWDSADRWLPVDIGSISVSSWSLDGSARTRYQLAMLSGSIEAGTTAVMSLTEVLPARAVLASGQFAFSAAPITGAATAVPLRRSFAAADLEFGGAGRIWGTTKTKGASANMPTKARVVLLHQRSKLLVRETWSDPATGAFEFTGIDTRQEYLTLAEDAAGSFRPVAASRLVPEAQP